MGTYLLLSHGGEVPDTEEARATATAAWTAWLARIGDAVVDPGTRTSVEARVVSSDGTVRDAPPTASGYTIVRADSLDAAADVATGCPALHEGGSVSVLEAREVNESGSVP
jgi:hypothetical protein